MSIQAKPRSRVRVLHASGVTQLLFGIERIEISATSVTLRKLGQKPVTVSRKRILEETIARENVFQLADAIEAMT